VDEIIDRRYFPILEQNMEEGYLHIALRYRNFLWYLNNRLGTHKTYRVFKTGEKEICLLPKGRARIMPPGYAGYHFSGCVGGDDWGRKYTDMNLIYGFTNDEIGNYDWDRFRKERCNVDKHRNETELHGDILTEVQLDEYPEFIAANPELFPWWGAPRFVRCTG
jgi:hypothetical protein